MSSRTACGSADTFPAMPNLERAGDEPLVALQQHRQGIIGR
ncbi:hypothetical protein SAMN05444920_14223 [Nonomuraea solani]|uniref:Uncharacterized protein n=1 Tax=Nonomuraea solani TaxID=1144553 RepID=A0A1H6F3T6_9ACTN|nr:hypothetical protein [Nonomuraea solani]SEH03705.1 hypothetical protein SAMN05444920_14223 [Nonomuraea solani]